MRPSRPYLIRALFDWILDNECTPYAVVNADVEGVSVPKDYVEDGRIILNIAPSATQNLKIDNDYITFSARFNGLSITVFLPMESVVAIYPREFPQYMCVLPPDIEPMSKLMDQEEGSSSTSKNVEHPADRKLDVIHAKSSAIDSSQGDKPIKRSPKTKNSHLKVIK